MRRLLATAFVIAILCGTFIFAQPPVPPAGETAPSPSGWVDSYLEAEQLDEGDRAHLTAAYVAGWYAGLGELDIDPHASAHLRLETLYLADQEMWEQIDGLRSGWIEDRAAIEQLAAAIASEYINLKRRVETLEQRGQP